MELEEPSRQEKPSALHRVLGKAVVKGMRDNQHLRWEVSFELSPRGRKKDGTSTHAADLWSETFHHLAARSIIRDFELLAEREREIEQGESKFPALILATGASTPDLPLGPTFPHYPSRSSPRSPSPRIHP